MDLNLATAAFFCALVELALGMGMWVLWVRQGARYLIYWSLGFCAFGAGAMLIALRERIPDFFSILVGNFTLTLSSILLYLGLCLFFDRRRSWLLWMVAVLSLEMGFLAYYSYITYDTATRVYVYSTAQALIALMTFQTLIAAGRERRKKVNPEVVVVVSLFLGAHGVRMVGSPVFPAAQDFLDSNSFQTLLSFGLMVIHIGYALAFGNMHASALHADLSAALADAKEKDRQKVEVLGYIGHDLRAPLATISGYSALLLATASEKQRKLILTVQRNIKYQLDLIDELLEYAKSELQPLAVKPVNTDLPLLLDDISEYAIVLCSQQKNGFRYHPSERMPRQIALDGKRLQQVLLNLLSNAAKFTRDGVVTLGVTAKLEGNACVLHFAVSDTGTGFDLNQGRDVFGAFQQVQTANGGTGLGLFIAQRIVSAMGGSLSVSSGSGQGTTFSFALSAPVISAADSAWSMVTKKEVDAGVRLPRYSLSRNTMLSNEALEELASLALHGRLTDVERWIERHANDVENAQFFGLLSDLLEQFDFPGIHALCVAQRE